MILAAVAAGVYLVSASLWPVNAPRPGVTKANYERIARGMTLGQVTSLLGGPPGDYRTGPVELDLAEYDWRFDNVMSDPDWLLGRVHPTIEWWQTDEGTFWVCFWDDGREIEKNFTPGKRVKQ